MKTKLVEVDGNDGTSHAAVARRLVEKQGFRVLSVRASGERCRHGAIVWSVEYEDKNDRHP